MKSKNILYFEDEKVVSKIVLEHISSIGYTAKTVTTGEAGLDLIEKEIFDLVFMDISLAGKLDGIEATKIINKKYSIPVIYLTTNSDDSTLNRVMETQHYGYLLKPSSKEELKVAIHLAFQKIELEKKLSVSQKNYKNLFDNAPEMIFSIKRDGTIDDVNKLGAEHLGYTKDDLIGETVWPLIHNKDLNSVKTQILDIFNTKNKKSELEFSKVKKDGSVINVLEHITFIEGNSTHTDRVLVMCQDITERKTIFEKLKESENLFLTFMNKIPGSVFIKDQTSQFLFANNYFLKHAKIKNYTDKYPEDIFTEEYAKKDRAEDKKVLTEGTLRFTDKGRDKAGNDNYYRIIKFPISRKNKPTIIGGIAIEITKEKTIENKLSLKEERLRLAIDAAKEGTFDRNLETNDFYLSPNLKEILGFGADDKVDYNTYWNKIVHPDDSIWAQQEIANHLEGNSDSYNIEYRIFKSNNEIGWLTERGKVVKYDKNNKPQRLMGVVIETTNKKKDEAELKKAKILAERGNKLKSEFLSNMSHEIRTPMNTIIGMTDIMTEEDINQEQEEYLNIIKLSSTHLLNLINNILDLSKIEAGEINITNVHFNLKETANEVIKTLTPLSSEKGLKLNFNFDSKIPESIIGDPIHIKQILYNLLGNAIKFTDEGNCTLGILKDEFSKKESTDIQIKFKISDTGIGVPKDKLLSIFDSFSQAKNSKSNKIKGTGLGLSITQRLVERFGGSIHITSTEGKGSTFSFQLKFPKAKVKKTEKEQYNDKEVKPQDSNQLNILVAEDNDLNQKLISILLKRMGHKYTIGYNGVEVLKLIKEENFDLIFMDIQMPIMNGIEATKTIRSSDNPTFNNQIPIVAVSAFAFEEDKKHFLEQGMNDFIPKPLNAGKIKSVIEVLQEKKLVRETA